MLIITSIKCPIICHIMYAHTHSTTMVLCSQMNILLVLRFACVICQCVSAHTHKKKHTYTPSRTTVLCAQINTLLALCFAWFICQSVQCNNQCNNNLVTLVNTNHLCAHVHAHKHIHTHSTICTQLNILLVLRLTWFLVHVILYTCTDITQTYFQPLVLTDIVTDCCNTAKLF